MNAPIDSFKKLATPFYAYDMALLRGTLDAINHELASRPAFHVHYAVKANHDHVILSEIASYGKLGADCVSGAEIEESVRCGIKPADIVYAGVGKTDAEIQTGLRYGIGCFNVESEAELEVIDQIAARMGVKANIALRVNPDIDAHTHPSITTGTYEDQFGIPAPHIEDIVGNLKKYPNVNLRGLHFHIGSQLTDMEPFRQLVDDINLRLDFWEQRGITFEWINVGGGLGVDYDEPDTNPVPQFAKYFAIFDGLNLRPSQQLHFELGRAVVAQCGSLISRVLYIKEGIGHTFAIVDAGFTDLIRPALYDAYHRIDVLTGSPDRQSRHYDVVGPVCESTDCFARNRELPELRRGDILAFRSAGAYGQSMASTYNMRQLPSSFYFNT